MKAHSLPQLQYHQSSCVCASPCPALWALLLRLQPLASPRLLLRLLFRLLLRLQPPARPRPAELEELTQVSAGLLLRLAMLGTAVSARLSSSNDASRALILWTMTDWRPYSVRHCFERSSNSLTFTSR